MRSAPLPSVILALLALASLGASCSEDGKGASDGDGERGSGGERSSGGERIESLPQVDLAELTTAEKRTWRDLVNDMLSPCGEPVSVARCVAEERACRTCVPAARFLARLVTEGYEKAEIGELYDLRYGRDRHVELDVGGAPVLGAPTAPVTIVEFSDFECPHCAAAHPLLKRLVRELDGQVRLVFMHYPLTESHQRAMPAARASVAAGRQGKFWEMHDLLFENRGALSDEDFERYARQIGLDVERFQRDMRSEESRRAVERDRALGRQVGVTGTPTLFVNGRRFRGPLRSLPAYIQEELDQ
jgi:protein-disulfide isomerase